MGWFSKGDKSQPKEESFYDDSHPTQARTSELETANEQMIQIHQQTMRIVNGEEFPSFEDMGRSGQELNALIDSMRAKGYELDVPGIHEDAERPWQFYRR